MRNVALSVLSSASLLLMSCGFIITETDDDTSPRSPTETRYSPPTTYTEPSFTATEHEVSGFILNGFDVTVDGQSYTDLEDFYTQEVARLATRVKAAGYDETWTTSFAADIGFQDLWNGMTVYVATGENRGFQAKSYVDSQGAFTVSFPKAASSNTFRIRATKRIQVLLAKGRDRRVLCYNFSAMEKAQPYAEDDKPIMLSQFATQITAYDCKEDENSGIVIPGNPDFPPLPSLPPTPPAPVTSPSPAPTPAPKL